MSQKSVVRSRRYTLDVMDGTALCLVTLSLRPDPFFYTFFFRRTRVSFRHLQNQLLQILLLRMVLGARDCGLSAKMKA